MKPPEGDPDLLRRAGQRCSRLAAELAAVESVLAAAAAGRGMRWSGTAAAGFGARATKHRRAVADTRAAVERLGALASVFAGELAEAQQRARTADAHAPCTGLEDRMVLSRMRLRRQLETVQAALTQVRLQLTPSSARWTGPLPSPPGLTGVRLTPSGRWTGPLPSPPGLTRRPVPPPAPAVAPPVAFAPLTRGGTGLPS